MQRQHSRETAALILGAALVVVGYLLGSLSRANPAQAQAIVDDDLSPFHVGRTTLITSSDDGTTLHFWSQAPAGSDRLLDARGFHYQGSRCK